MLIEAILEYHLNQPKSLQLKTEEEKSTKVDNFVVSLKNKNGLWLHWLILPNIKEWTSILVKLLKNRRGKSSSHLFYEVNSTLIPMPDEASQEKTMDRYPLWI